MIKKSSKNNQLILIIAFFLIAGSSFIFYYSYVNKKSDSNTANQSPSFVNPNKIPQPDFIGMYTNDTYGFKLNLFNNYKIQPLGTSDDINKETDFYIMDKNQKEILSFKPVQLIKNSIEESIKEDQAFSVYSTAWWGDREPILKSKENIKILNTDAIKYTFNLKKDKTDLHIVYFFDVKHPFRIVYHTESKAESESLIKSMQKL